MTRAQNHYCRCVCRLLLWRMLTPAAHPAFQPADVRGEAERVVLPPNPIAELMERTWLIADDDEPVKLVPEPVGWNVRPVLTLAETGAIVGLSGARVQQIEREALGKIKRQLEAVS